MAVRLGRNPYGEWVEESPTGIRRVATSSGWKNEGSLPSLRFCRWNTNHDRRMAVQSLAHSSLLASFKNRPSLAFAVWSTRQGQVTVLDEKILLQIESSRSNTSLSNKKLTSPSSTTPDLSWSEFETAVKKAWASQAVQVLSHHQGWSGQGPTWDWILKTPLSQSELGLWWGLSKRTLDWQEGPKAIWVWEMGLLDAESAASRLLSPSTRRILTSTISGRREAPHAELIKGYPKPPSQKHTFHPTRLMGSGETQEDPTHVILWATKQALETHGDPSMWFDWLLDNSGYVVFDTTIESQKVERVLGQKLAQVKKIPKRIFVTIDDKVVYHLWSCNQDNNSVTPKVLSLSDFAGLPPPLKVDNQGPVDDVGRVSYRPGNPDLIAEGCAPQRLEAAMHHALALLWEDPKTVEASLEKVLGMSKGTLHDHLSPEQVDAILLARQSLYEGGGFVLSDETGFGKGRTLAAIARLGLSEGRAVVFVTENPNLFSDLHRDLLATGEGIVPTLLHQDATIRSQGGEIFAKSVNGDAFKALMKEKKWKKDEPKFIMTTYAQLGRAVDETPKKGRSKKIEPGQKAQNFDPSDGKLAWLRSRMGEGAWLLLDEAHNAAGTSQINERLGKIIKQAGGVVFASATYARKEDNLGVYTDALPIETWTRKLLHQALSNDEGILRETLTTAMAEAGRLVRREHPPVPPPQPLWVPVDAKLSAQVDAFGDFWRHLFRAGELALRMGGEQNSVWMKLGGLLSRSIREFSMWAKTDNLLEFIEEKIKNNEKVVIALESTMEAALKETLLDTSTSDDEGDEGAQTVVRTRLKLSSEPLWKDRWRKVLQEWVPEELLASAHQMGQAFDEQLRAAVHGANEALDRWPDWGLSPLDVVQSRLQARGIKSGELSGRHNCLVQEGGFWVLSGRTKASTDRQALVRSFNEGDIDVIWITRAGCAGISLHAGKTFKDQRKRNLIEWDIPVNPANRVQFWGRVRRKDQVQEPEFWGLALDIPLERRRLEREERKRKWLAAHAGTAGAALVAVPELPWLSPEGESLVGEWASLHPKHARRIGVHMPQQDNPTGRIDRALLRAIVLPPTVQQTLWQHLEGGLHWAKDVGGLEREQLAHLPSRIVRSRWWWGDPRGVEDGRLGALDCPRVDVVERIWSPQKNPDVTALRQALSKALSDNQNGQTLLETFQNLPVHLPDAEATFASAHLAKLSPGQGIEFSRPGTGELIRAMVLRVSPWAGASTGPVLTSLSQSGVQVWGTGESRPWWIPLSRLASDPLFRPLGQAQSSWFEVPPAPMIGLTLEGNAILAAAWGQRWNAGRALLINDVNEGLRSVWALPRSWTWADVQALPRDLLDADHLLLFWREHSDQPAFAALPGHESWVAQPIAGGVVFRWESSSYDIARTKWIPFQVDRRLGHAKQSRGMVERQVSWRDLPALLHSWAALGLGWRIDASHATWHQSSATARMQAFRKQALIAQGKKSKS